ncbi:hypothetical protein CYMTET_46267, partial [Cymbomonas tetramitiformis]
EMETGDFEERWSSLLKVAEIYERFYHDWPSAERYYRSASSAAPDRPDPLFYLGQHMRAAGDFSEAIRNLQAAAKRADAKMEPLATWDYMNSCLVHVEMGRAAEGIPSLQGTELRTVRKSLATALRMCPPDHYEEVESIFEIVEMRQMNILRQRRPSNKQGLAKSIRSTVKGFLKFVAQKAEDIEGAFSLQVIDRRPPLSETISATQVSAGSVGMEPPAGLCLGCTDCPKCTRCTCKEMDPWEEIHTDDNWKPSFDVVDLYRPLQVYLEGMQAISEQPNAGCRDYRLLFHAYHLFFQGNSQDMQQLLMNSLQQRNGTVLFDEWTIWNMRLKSICR